MDINSIRKVEEYQGPKMPIDRAIREQKSYCDGLFLEVQFYMNGKYQSRTPCTYQEVKAMARRFKELAGEMDHLVALEDGMRNQL